MVSSYLNISKDNMSLLWKDILKFLTIILIVNILLYFVDSQGDLLDEQTLKLMLYVALALIFYHVFIVRFFFSNTEVMYTTNGNNNNNNKTESSPPQITTTGKETFDPTQAVIKKRNKSKSKSKGTGKSKKKVVRFKLDHQKID